MLDRRRENRNRGNDYHDGEEVVQEVIEKNVNKRRRIENSEVECEEANMKDDGDEE
jgi:DNA-directed RNA polymerase specialized sigma24 family protein